MASIIKANQLQDFGGNSILTSDGAGVVTPNADGIKMTPAFHANLSSDQSVSDNTFTKVQFDRETFDTNSAYDATTNYRFTVPSGQAGKYFFYFNVLSGGTLSAVDQNAASFYLNGSSRGTYGADFRNNPVVDHICNGSIVFDLSVGDYVEIFGKVNFNTGSGSFKSGATSRPDECCFGGYKLIGA
jgi:hypothetical protein